MQTQHTQAPRWRHIVSKQTRGCHDPTRDHALHRAGIGRVLYLAITTRPPPPPPHPPAPPSLPWLWGIAVLDAAFPHPRCDAARRAPAAGLGGIWTDSCPCFLHLPTLIVFPLNASMCIGAFIVLASASCIRSQNAEQTNKQKKKRFVLHHNHPVSLSFQENVLELTVIKTPANNKATT